MLMAILGLLLALFWLFQLASLIVGNKPDKFVVGGSFLISAIYMIKEGAEYL